MAPNSVLLDTSVVIRHFREAATVADKLATYDELYLPVSALAELYYGAFRSDRSQVHINQIERFLVAADVLTPDQETARHYGKIAAQLARKELRFRKMTFGWLRSPSSAGCLWPLPTSTSSTSTD